jgi:drug/metabolite transporter (DMT)-like permease
MTTLNRTLPWRHLGLFVFIILTWGLSWPINKIGLEYMSPLWYTAIRLVIGAATMMAFVTIIGKFSLPERRDFPLIIVIGLFQISIYILLVNYGLLYLPAGRSSLIAYTTPLFVMPITIFIFKEPASTLKWLGFIVGTAGLIMLINPWDMDWSNGHVVFGSAMLLLASFIWAITMLCARYMEWNKSPLQLMPWQLLVGAIPILIFAFIKEPNVTIPWTNTTLVLSLIYTGFLVTGLSYWAGVVICKEIPTTIASLGFLIVPVVSIFVSAYFMNEIIGLTTIAASALILLGLALITI